jgi:hypothetical protein
MKSLLQIRSDKPFVNFFSWIGMAAVLLLIASAPAAVAQNYGFTFTGNDGIDATGTIDISGGVAIGGSINVINVPLESLPGTTTASGDLLTAGGDARNFDGDVITYDTVANPPPADPMFDNTGVCFGSSIINGNTTSAPAAYDGGTPVYDTLVNVWGNSPGSYTMFIGEANPSDLEPDGTLIPGRDAQWGYVYGENGTMTFNPIVPAPEPSTDALIILGALTVGFAAIRRRRTVA